MNQRFLAFSTVDPRKPFHQLPINKSFMLPLIDLNFNSTFAWLVALFQRVFVIDEGANPLTFVYVFQLGCTFACWPFEMRAQRSISGGPASGHVCCVRVGQKKQAKFEDS